jgi:two-component system, chemotaxis family, chemotaxis protein CheY
MAQFSELTNVGAIAPYADDVPPPSPGAPRRGEILLIEDCTEVREGLAQLLELHGYMVTEFADGERGMRELTTQPQAFALVILDLMLGDSMAGMEFRLQQLLDSQLASVPTIVITASDVSVPDRMPLRPEGWLEKPFRFDTLLELVKRYVIAEGSGLISDQQTLEEPPEPDVRAQQPAVSDPLQSNTGNQTDM